jgi:lipopolysaccharide/colanic/teichoic acid biosynthesis glycosyltransferase
MSGKRLFDIFVAALALALLWPLMLLIALVVRLESPGPSLFRQTRIGRHGRSFDILKFRTMPHDTDLTDPGLASNHDPRILKFGRLLRDYKFNELPQLFNVLCGDMSMVGPRPELPSFVRLYKQRDLEALLSVRPGITDPASLRYRDEGAILALESDPHRAYVERIMPRKHAISRWYLRRQSLLGDLAIVFATAYAIISPRSVPRARLRALRQTRAAIAAEQPAYQLAAQS